jgi:hypothetical protein
MYQTLPSELSVLKNGQKQEYEGQHLLNNNKIFTLYFKKNQSQEIFSFKYAEVERKYDNESLKNKP